MTGRPSASSAAPQWRSALYGQPLPQPVPAAHQHLIDDRAHLISGPDTT